MRLFIAFFAFFPLIVDSSSVKEIECSTEEHYTGYHCVEDDVSVLCVIRDVRIEPNFGKNSTEKQQEMLITNADSYNFTRIEFRGTSFYVFPTELITQIPKVEFISTSSSGMEIIRDYSFANATSLKQFTSYGTKLQEITKYTFYGATQLRGLVLWANEIKHIDKHAFDTLTELTRLDLDDNELEIIDKELLQPLKKLKFLNLSDNKFKTIGRDFFSENNQLVKLSLADNALEELELRINDKLMKLDLDGNELQSLILTGNNQIVLKDLSVDGNNLTKFQVEVKLQELSIRNNNLKDFKLISDATTLTSLYIDNNPISNISGLERFTNLQKIFLDNTEIKLTPYIFALLPQLKHISLSNSNLGNVQIDWFKNLPKLQTLLLNENGLTELDYEDFAKLPSLHQISISDNKFNCSYLREMMAFIKNKTSIKILDAYEYKFWRQDHINHVDNVICIKEDDESVFFRNFTIIISVLVIAGICLGFFMKKSQWDWRASLSSYMTYRPFGNMRSDPVEQTVVIAR